MPFRVGVVVALWVSSAWAQQATQCDGRVYRTLLGTAHGYPASAASVDDALSQPLFFNRFAAFINSRLNSMPGTSHGQNALFFVARHVLSTGRPWRDVFVGPFNVPNRDYPQVEEDPNGIGYFTSGGWLERYAGNESEGYMLVAANRILQNTIGHERVAAANNSDPDVPNNATGRQAAACAGCHYLGPYALDYVARVLPRKRVSTNNQVTFEPAPGAPQPVLGTMVSSERELIETLVSSEAFRFWTCRLAFQFVYGRSEYACEASLFDRCVDAFSATGMVQSAVKTLIEDPGFCG